MFQKKVVEKIKTRVLRSVTSLPPPRNLRCWWDNVEKYCRAGRATDDSMACWLPKATNAPRIFYIHGSVHRNYINKIQQGATICRYLFTVKLLYMFRVSSHPPSGVQKTVTAASGTGHVTYQGKTFCQRGLIRPRWLKVVALIRDMTCTRSCSYRFLYFWWWVRWHPKHIE